MPIICGLNLHRQSVHKIVQTGGELLVVPLILNVDATNSFPLEHGQVGVWLTGVETAQSWVNAKNFTAFLFFYRFQSKYMIKI